MHLPPLPPQVKRLKHFSRMSGALAVATSRRASMGADGMPPPPSPLGAGSGLGTGAPAAFSPFKVHSCSALAAVAPIVAKLPTEHNSLVTALPFAPDYAGRGRSPGGRRDQRILQ